MRSQFRATGFALGFLVVAGVAQAQTKIAYINSEVLMSAAPGRAAADSALNKLGEGFRAQLGKLQDSAQAILTKYQKDEPKLTQAQKDKAQKDLGVLENELQTKQQQFSQQFSARQQELMAPITDLVKRVIDDIRTEGGFAMILDNAPGASIIVAADKNLDITDKVVSRLRATPAPKLRLLSRRRVRRHRRPGDAAPADAVIAGATQQDKGGESAHVLTAAAIADVVGGRLIGDGSVRVTGVAPLDRATPFDLSFLGIAKYASVFTTSQAGVVLMSPELAETPGRVNARIVVERPQESLLALLPRFSRAPSAEPGVHPTAVIGANVQLGEGVSVGPYAVLGDGVCIGDGSVIGPHCVVGAGVTIGMSCQLYPSVTVYSGSMIGDRATIHAGARIGSDGFGYVQRDGQHLKIPHVGRCIIEQDVEIGANTTIDRGSIDDTVIGAGTKVDNLVQIAHNVRIGRLV